MGTTLTATGLPQYQQAPTKDSDLRTKLRSLWGPICLLSSLNTYRKHRYTTDHHGCHTPTAAQLSFSPPLGQLRWQNHPGLWQLLHRVIIAAQASPWYQANGWRLCAHVASCIPTCGERGYKYKQFIDHISITHSFVTRAAATQ